MYLGTYVNIQVMRICTDTTFLFAALCLLMIEDLIELVKNLD